MFTPAATSNGLPVTVAVPLVALPDVPLPSVSSNVPVLLAVTSAIGKSRVTGVVPGQKGTTPHQDKSRAVNGGGPEAGRVRSSVPASRLNQRLRQCVVSCRARFPGLSVTASLLLVA